MIIFTSIWLLQWWWQWSGSSSDLVDSYVSFLFCDVFIQCLIIVFVVMTFLSVYVSLSIDSVGDQSEMQ